MELNDLKFELLRYGLNLLLKNSGYTIPNGDAITTKTEVKDLGVIMSNDGLFTKQIDAVCVKAKNSAKVIDRMVNAGMKDFQKITLRASFSG